MCHVQDPSNSSQCKQYVPYYKLRQITSTSMEKVIGEPQEEAGGD